MQTGCRSDGGAQYRSLQNGHKRSVKSRKSAPLMPRGGNAREQTEEVTVQAKVKPVQPFGPFVIYVGAIARPPCPSHCDYRLFGQRENDLTAAYINRDSRQAHRRHRKRVRRGHWCGKSCRKGWGETFLVTGSFSGFRKDSYTYRRLVGMCSANFMNLAMVACAVPSRTI
jgi:hypothetical protein